jgi:hypothetical protein
MATFQVDDPELIDAEIETTGDGSMHRVALDILGVPFIFPDPVDGCGAEDSAARCALPFERLG